VIKCQHLRQCVIQPILKKIGLYSLDAEELLIATAAHESLGGYYLIQENSKGIFTKGGLGIYQMEGASFNDLWKHFQRMPELIAGLKTACNLAEDPDSYQMVGNLEFATVMARVFYFRDPKPLPKHDDLDEIWLYYKRVWNTNAGRATKESFVKNYHAYIKGK